MIYLNDTRTVQTAYIPRNTDAGGDVPLALSLRSTIDLAERDLVIIRSECLPLYWRVHLIVPSGMPHGEYEYALSSDGNILSSGIVTIVWERNVYEHNDAIEYEQYGG